MSAKDILHNCLARARWREKVIENDIARILSSIRAVENLRAAGWRIVEKRSVYGGSHYERGEGDEICIVAIAPGAKNVPEKELGAEWAHGSYGSNSARTRVEEWEEKEGEDVCRIFTLVEDK